jgi:hypothetical protein
MYYRHMTVNITHGKGSEICMLRSLLSLRIGIMGLFYAWYSPNAC